MISRRQVSPVRSTVAIAFADLGRRVSWKKMGLRLQTCRAENMAQRSLEIPKAPSEQDVAPKDARDIHGLLIMNM